VGSVTAGLVSPCHVRAVLLLTHCARTRNGRLLGADRSGLIVLQRSTYYSGYSTYYSYYPPPQAFHSGSWHNPLVCASVPSAPSVPQLIVDFLSFETVQYVLSPVCPLRINPLRCTALTLVGTGLYRIVFYMHAHSACFILHISYCILHTSYFTQLHKAAASFSQ
jgi:hypothetical protein